MYIDIKPQLVGLVTDYNTVGERPGDDAYVLVAELLHFITFTKVNGEEKAYLFFL